MSYTTTDPHDAAHAATTPRLIDLADQIEAHRQRRGWSFAKLRQTVPQIGSDRQFGRVRAGEPVGDEWLPRYEAALAALESMPDRPQAPETYDDLTLPRALRVAMAGAMRSDGLDRVVVLTAPSGMGKTQAGTLLRERLVGRLVWAEADPTWNQSSSMLAGIARSLGVRQPPDGAARCLRIVLEALAGGRRAIAIDEAHHLGPQTLNICKTIINQSEGELLLLAIPSLWRRLEGQAYEEARQLTRNRLHERIALDRLPERDARMVIERRVPTLAAEAALAARMYCGAAAATAPQHGGEARNLALLVAVCREAAMNEATTAAQWAEALQSVTSRR